MAELPINQIICGDCLEVLKTFPDNSIDTIITDPPYGLEFMGKEWDRLGNIGEGRSKKPTPAESGQPFNKRIGRVSYNATQNVKCRKCGHWKFSGTPCKCENPDFPNLRAIQAKEMENWHFNWAKECLRVVKPGATLLCFGGTRTWHRLACAIEDAGWIIKDTIMWIYGSGFPKATDISKQLDKRAGEERKVIGKRTDGRYKYNFQETNNQMGQLNPVKSNVEKIGQIEEPATLEAQLWNGWKSHGLKPSYEPILLCMKPNEGSYAENALKWGVAGLNIDGGRIGTIPDKSAWFANRKIAKTFHGQLRDNRLTAGAYKDNQGRFPANLILECICDEVREGVEITGSFRKGNRDSRRASFDFGSQDKTNQGYKDKILIHTNPECPCYMLDNQSGKTGAFAPVKSGQKGFGGTIYGKYKQAGDNGATFYNDGFGGASRFFYVAKASRAERNMGCEGLEGKQVNDGRKDQTSINMPAQRGITYRKNSHPTVKPLKLMEYLCILTKTPTGGIILDPFAGSGTTGMAAKKTKRNYILIEKEEEYCKIARARIKATPSPLF